MRVRLNWVQSFLIFMLMTFDVRMISTCQKNDFEGGGGIPSPQFFSNSDVPDVALILFYGRVKEGI